MIGFAKAADAATPIAPARKAADKTLRIFELPPTSDF
jgi:hypothetical protein